MELIRITPSENKLWEQVWRLYNESFPEYERRRISSHARACEDDDFNTCIAVENGNLQALLFYWKNDRFIYVEHIAVNPNMRGRQIGSRLLGEFIAGCDRPVILEIDPPQDDISKRRLEFYRRLGFISNDYPYTHPSYTRNGHGHQLVILSFPEPLHPEGFEDFREYVQRKILSYID